ncbi:NAD-dependent epimerase/dehydratase family protein [bacterium]|nr:NAD-dependent epimerase/dehydratase family protein [candidate division CSSED10-310 bacterium]
MHRVLITGATGFIGRHLTVRLVETGIAVHALFRTRKPDRFPVQGEIQWIKGDIRDGSGLADAVRGVDTVFNTAAVLGPPGLKDRIYLATNRDGVQNIISACRSAGSVERMVQVSSVGVLGALKPRERACEGTPPRPLDIYERSKLAGEEIALEAARDGFPVVIARPAWVYGPGDTRTLKLFRRIAHRRFFISGPAQNKQHPVWISDVVDGLIRCAVTPGIEGRVYHLAGPEVLTVETLCRTVAEAAGVNLRKFRPPVWLVLPAAYAVEKLFAAWNGNPPLDRRKLWFFTIHRAYSIERAKEELGWEPELKFADGIARTLKWYREHGQIR